jgi:lipopolysaccharide export LptBFGC system permease protein LptF
MKNKLMNFIKHVDLKEVIVWPLRFLIIVLGYALISMILLFSNWKMFLGGVLVVLIVFAILGFLFAFSVVYLLWAFLGVLLAFVIFLMIGFGIPGKNELIDKC